MLTAAASTGPPTVRLWPFSIPHSAFGIDAVPVQVEGVVREQRPNGLYEVEIAGARRILAHAGTGRGRNFVRLLVGDRVAVELTARDVTRGRIVKRL